MSSSEEYISRIEETCGEEKHFIIFLKHEKKDEALYKILRKAKLENSISSIIFEINYKSVPMRVYASGKILARKVKDKNTLLNLLSELLS
ncbi:MAG: hypothetical protein N3F10_04370 [Candidatus Bathyarchaeota archaeon]|nr:hypothetical protein [Candidatus Bathyarchaeota archaeon]MCX8177516.1 hypothetical protein [Candidatus Bathyarchaeota archaeon]MDW8194542.1 hypothetical protein [Nitrososphaerota archaeon]